MAPTTTFASETLATPHAKSAREVLNELGVSEKGLGNDEIRLRRQKFGWNELAETPPPPRWLRFLAQFNQPIVWLLLSAVVICAVLAEWTDAGAILAIVFLNGGDRVFAGGACGSGAGGITEAVCPAGKGRSRRSHSICSRSRACARRHFGDRSRG
ncbi:MAG: hypothetical protein KatS3mg105_3525 [Gemmatales bacterium]|nr:MAG: hypothetical protein KatS3mg105_3525 [Gemmatales bacterium]